MADSMLDWLVYGLVALVFVVFNYVAGKRAQREKRQPVQVPPATYEAESSTDPYAWGRQAEVEPVVEAWVPPAPRIEPRPLALRPTLLALPSRAARVRSQLRDTRGMRDAVVLMTVLGPCAADKDRMPNRARGRRTGV